MRKKHIVYTFLLLALFLIVIFSLSNNTELVKAEYKILGELWSIQLDILLLVVFLLGGIGSFLIYREIRLDKNLTWTSSRYFTKALNHLYSGKYDEALEKINIALTKSPKNYDLLMTAGVIYKRLKNYEESYNHFFKAYDKKPTVQAVLKMIDLLANSFVEKDDREFFKNLKKLSKEDRVPAYKEFAKYLKKKGEWELALEVVKKANNIEENTFGKDQLAEIKFELGKKNSNEKIMKEIVTTYPDFAPGLIAYAEILQKVGKKDEMIEVLKKGFSTTKLVVFLQKLEDYFLENEMPEKAVEVLGEIVLNENHNVLARYYLGKLYYRLEMLEKAKEIFKNLEGEIEFIPGLYYHLAKIFYRLGDHETSYSYMKELVSRSDILKFKFICKSCETYTDEWTERCPSCNAIGSIRMRYEEIKSEDIPFFML